MRPAPGPPPKLRNFRVERLLGSGGFGDVWLATQAGFDRSVALKVVRLGGKVSERALGRFRREARVLAHLDHPSIIRLWDFGELGDDGLYLAMQYVEGTSLQERLKQGNLDLEEVRALGLALARALAHAHGEGVLHRDLKPANVLLHASGRPYLADFGLASAMEEEWTRLTQSGAVLGTPQYLPPELLLSEPVGPPGDLYSLATLLQVALTGKPPFDWVKDYAEVMRRLDRDPDPIGPDLAPPWFRELILGCLARNPAARPTAAALAEALEAGAPPRDTLVLPVEASREGEGGKPAPAPDPSPRDSEARLGWVLPALGGALLGLLLLAARARVAARTLVLEAAWVEYGPRGYRVQARARNALGVSVEGRSASPDPGTEGLWRTEWTPLRERTRALLTVTASDGDSTASAEVDLGGDAHPGWEFMTLPPKDLAILARWYRPLPYPHPGEDRWFGWFRIGADDEVPPEWFEGMDAGWPGDEIRLSAGTWPEGALRLALLAEVRGGRLPSGVSAGLGSGPAVELASVLAAGTAGWTPGVSVSVRTLAAEPPGGRLTAPAGPRGEAAPRAVWLATTGDGRWLGDDLEVLVSGLRTALHALDFDLIRILDLQVEGTTVIGDILGGVSRGSRLAMAKQGNKLEVSPWKERLHDLQARVDELQARFAAFPAEVPGEVALRYLFHLIRFCRALDTMEGLLDREKLPPRANARYADLARVLWEGAFGTVAVWSQDSPESKRMGDLFRDVAAGLPLELRPWVRYLEARARLDARAVGYAPQGELLVFMRRVVEACEALPSGFEPPYGGRRDLFRELALQLLSTREPVGDVYQGFRSERGLALVRRLADLLGTLDGPLAGRDLRMVEGLLARRRAELAASGTKLAPGGVAGGAGLARE